MRLAFLHVDLPPEGEGGVSYQVDLLACEMAKRHDLEVFTTVPTSAARPFPVACCKRPRLGPASRVFGVGLAFGRLDLRRFDVIHAHGDSWAVRHPAVVRTFYGTAACEALSAVSLKRRTGQTVQYGLELLACASAEYRTTIGTHAKKFLPRIDRVIPCGVDPEIFYPGGERFDQPTVLFVAGRLGGRKRGWLALDAFRFARQEVPEARMIVVSRDTVEQPGVECQTALSNEEMGQLYRQSWVLCSASTYEGFGLPYAEALASGLPIVTTRNPGIDEILPGQTGVVVADHRLGEALVSALSQRPPMAVKTNEPMRDRFRIDRVADEFDEVYEQVRVK